jgi:hypothetical protein
MMSAGIEIRGLLDGPRRTRRPRYLVSESFRQFLDTAALLLGLPALYKHPPEENSRTEEIRNPVLN